jgi:hypothetical protein
MSTAWMTQSARRNSLSILSRSLAASVLPNRFSESIPATAATADRAAISAIRFCSSMSVVPPRTEESNPSEKKTTYLRP